MIGSVDLTLELGALAGKGFRQGLHDLSDKLVSLRTACCGSSTKPFWTTSQVARKSSSYCVWKNGVGDSSALTEAMPVLLLGGTGETRIDHALGLRRLCGSHRSPCRENFCIVDHD